MIVQGTSVGLDVHALSVVAHAVDEETGKVARARLRPDHREVLSWLHQLRAPVRVTYEAGPTGFGLARAITEAGMECLVAAPSKLQRPAGDASTVRGEAHRPLHPTTKSWSDRELRPDQAKLGLGHLVPICWEGRHSSAIASDRAEIPIALG